MCFLRPKTAVAILGRLYLDVYTGREVEPLKRIHRARGGLLDVYEALVRVQLEVLARILILERPPDYGIHALLCGQRDGAEYKGPRPFSRLDDGLRRFVYNLMVKGLKLYPDLGYRHENLLHDLGNDASSYSPPTLSY